jgi:acetate kinase
MINGIKPAMKTTTKLRIKPTSFDEAMDVFCTKLEQDAQEYIERFNHMDSVTFKACGGVKYIKVKYFQTNIDTDYETGKKTLVEDTNGSIHCFVEKTTGDIFKPAGYKG